MSGISAVYCEYLLSLDVYKILKFDEEELTVIIHRLENIILDKEIDNKEKINVFNKILNYFDYFDSAIQSLLISTTNSVIINKSLSLSIRRDILLLLLDIIKNPIQNTDIVSQIFSTVNNFITDKFNTNKSKIIIFLELLKKSTQDESIVQNIDTLQHECYYNTNIDIDKMMFLVCEFYERCIDILRLYKKEVSSIYHNLPKVRIYKIDIDSSYKERPLGLFFEYICSSCLLLNINNNLKKAIDNVDSIYMNNVINNSKEILLKKAKEKFFNELKTNKTFSKESFIKIMKPKENEKIIRYAIFRNDNGIAEKINISDNLKKIGLTGTEILSQVIKQLQKKKEQQIEL